MQKAYPNVWLVPSAWSRGRSARVYVQSCMCAQMGNPLIKIGLHFLQRRIELLAESNDIELILDGAVEALANAVFGATGVDVLNGQIQRCSEPQNAVPGYAQQRHILLRKEGQHPRSAAHSCGHRACQRPLCSRCR